MKLKTYTMLVVLALSQWISSPVEARHGGMQSRCGRSCQMQLRQSRCNGGRCSRPVRGRGVRSQGRRFNQVSASILLRSGGRRGSSC